MSSNGIFWVGPLLMSNGGPLVLATYDRVESWSGYAGDDYDHACEVALCPGVFSAAGDVGVLLGGDAPVTCIGQCGDGVVVLRLVTVQPPFRLPETVVELEGESVESDANVRVKRGKWVLFHAVIVGENLHQKDAIEIDVASDVQIICDQLVREDGAEYLVYTIPQSSVQGAPLRDWIRARGIKLEG